MVPDYLTAIRYQDKRVFTVILLVLVVTLACYWRNSVYRLSAADALPLSIILTIVLLNLIGDLKAYWVYSAALKRVDLRYFAGKTCSRMQAYLTRPPAIAGLSVALFWVIIHFCALRLSPPLAILCVLILATALIWLAYAGVRSLYIRQLGALSSETRGERPLSRYVGSYAALIFIVNLLSISPLKKQPAFSMEEGLLSPALMIAMFILYAVVLAFNIAFSLPSKKYIFLGRLLSNETAFHFAARELMPGLKRYPLVVRLGLLAALQAAWIVMLSMLLTAGAITPPFEVWYLLCGLPMMGYVYCHIYWRWHNDFRMACDMYFRFHALEQLKLIE